jgi:hypothetical protein
MDLERHAGLIVGTLLIVQMAGSAIVNFRLEAPLFGEPGFLVNAAAYGPQIGLSALVGIAVGALCRGESSARLPPEPMDRSLCVIAATRPETTTRV